MGIFESFGKMVETGVQHGYFRQFIHAERNVAAAALEAYARQLNAEQFDDFLRQFLKHSLLLVDENKRVRATELFGYLKVVECDHFGGFRGFLGDGGALG